MTALNNLDTSWQDWLQTNLDNQVAPQNLATILYQNGFVVAAYELMAKYNHVTVTPRIDMSTNTIKLADKEVSLLFTSSQPTIVLIDGFLSPDECQSMIDFADLQLETSKVVDPIDGSFIEHKERTSTSVGFQRGVTDLITTIENRISSLLNFPVDHGEGLQVLRYENGGEYKPHYDYFDPANKSSEIATKKGGQRVGTFLMYLSDVDAGGSTAFPKLHFQMHPKAGMALYFANTHFDGSIDDKTLHAGVPVIEGVKYLATKWLREKPYV